MMSYTTMLTPPSSNEDSPPVYFVASPSSSSFQGPEGYDHVMEYTPINIRPHVYLDQDSILDHPKASLQFIEQPTDRFRFRYKSEMAGTHGSLTGMNSDKSRKQTYPTVELRNFPSKAIVRCSIYQINAKDKENMPHAHRLIMKKGKEEQDDPHDMTIGPEQNFKACFHGMGIIHTAKKNIVGELIKKKTKLKKEEVARMDGKVRELNTKEMVEIKGLAETESKSINLNIVCLRFDAFVEQEGILYPLCDPIFSHGINNLKSALTGDLRIVRLDHVVDEAKGGKEIFILVERVTKKNIKVRFLELDDQDQVIWEDWGKFNDLDVHHQYAIVFKTPKYHNQNIKTPVKVFIELFRPSDEARSEPREFRYIPNENGQPGSKRRRYDYSSSYKSSDYGSDELPSTICNIKAEQEQDRIQINAPISGSSSLNIPENLSEELQRALADFNGRDFQNLFNKHSDEITAYFTTDAPHNASLNQHSRLPLLSTINNQQHTIDSVTQTVIKLEVSLEDRRKAAKFIEELKSFVKATKNNVQRAQGFFTSYLGKDKVTNALHILVSLNKIQEIVYVLQMLRQSKKLDLLEKRNEEEQTPLHLAILCRNFNLIVILLRFSSSVAAVDADSNSALHYAVKEGLGADILKCFLMDRFGEKVASYIDLKNNDGNTALFLAIDKNDCQAVNLLCSKGANINEVHPKNGFVPLRSAIEKQYVAIVKYLLSLPKIVVTIEDFNNVTPLTAAIQKECSKELKEIILKYMDEHNIVRDIKQEETDSEEDTEEDTEIKIEPMAVDDLEELYKDVKTFTPTCLEEISEILDASNIWGSLAELLGFDHLVSSGIIHNKSMSKAVLKYATESIDASVWEIRNFLESLDETRAVQRIDRMVQDLRF